MDDARAGAVVFETIATQEGLDALAGEWDDLVRAMPRPSPFLLHGWVSQWWRHCGNGAELAIYVARRDGQLVGALPLFTWRTAGLRVTEFVGGQLSALADVLLLDPADEATTRMLCERTAETGGDLVDLFGLPGNSRLAHALGDERLRLIERVEAPVLELEGGWDAVYREKTDSKKRNLHKRRRRQLAELGRLEVTTARTLEELEPALEDAFALHELRWAGRPDGSGFATESGRRFHQDALRELAKIDAPRIVTLKLDGRPIAFHYFFAFANRMYVHRLAFDPELSRYSPGLVNTLDALQAAADEGLERVEYLGGAERYKLELSDRLEPLYQGLGLAGSLKGRAVLAARLGKIRARRRLRSSHTLHRLYLNGLTPLRRRLPARRR
ncbi:MAG: GNAT family N-acetyltransferase [Actinomycetota bacterium]|nr:GNAT family N-acetyltransferase [Actinomycetota bacterium]